jgi:hypothetical protein
MGHMATRQTLAAGSRNVRLRELTGYDELAIDRTDSAAAIALIDRLCTAPAEHVPHSNDPGVAFQLTAFERDQILAGIYAHYYGKRIDSTLTCATCSKPFDIAFDLDELIGRAARPSDIHAAPDGSYCLESGVRFRLPTGGDELAVLHLSPDEAVGELLRRCMLEAPGGFDPGAVQDAMEQVAPIIDIDVNTSCPECGTGAQSRFDLQSYLLQSILQDRRRLWRETHVLAIAYKWSLQDILGLARPDRRTLVALIESNMSRVP